MQEYDFVSIGDLTIDAFIRLTDAHVDAERGMLCMRFKDKIPYEAVYEIPAVGNSANAAVAAARLGLKTAFISNLGDDDWGRKCLKKLEGDGVATEYIRAHKGRKTNYHYVLWFHDDRTILVKHEEYPYTLPDFGDPRWLYLSSMASNSLPFHADIETYLDAHPDIKLAFQPGTYQMKFGREALAGIYGRAYFFVSNKEEAERILETTESDIKELLNMMATLGPKIVVITDGKKGAYAREEDGTVWMMPPYPDPKPPLDRTGAGDAFSSTLTAGLALGLSLEDALRWAPINSMSVVQYVGAQEGLLTREKIEEYLAKAPDDYTPREI